jgi:hypothetical protein
MRFRQILKIADNGGGIEQFDRGPRRMLGIEHRRYVAERSRTVMPLARLWANRRPGALRSRIYAFPLSA